MHPLQVDRGRSGEGEWQARNRLWGTPASKPTQIWKAVRPGCQAALAASPYLSLFHKHRTRQAPLPSVRIKLPPNLIRRCKRITNQAEAILSLQPLPTPDAPEAQQRQILQSRAMMHCMAQPQKHDPKQLGYHSTRQVPKAPSLKIVVLIQGNGSQAWRLTKCHWHPISSRRTTCRRTTCRPLNFNRKINVVIHGEVLWAK